MNFQDLVGQHIAIHTGSELPSGTIVHVEVDPVTRVQWLEFEPAVAHNLPHSVRVWINSENVDWFQVLTP
jgi:hypothetical protein